MAFLDNSGDIILDAVLTDAGRQRLSRGNFKIVKFAFGDEEINYGTFNKSHPSGSAFYDLEVMQTPILEAFTNNTSLMKSKLVTMTRNNILYMPIFKVNTLPTHAGNATGQSLNFNSFLLTADNNTEFLGANTDSIIALKQGILRGSGTNISSDNTRHIAIDQGIDSTEGGLSFRQPIPLDLVETAYLIKMDHRLIRLASVTTNQTGLSGLTNQFVDDDGIATYYVVQGDGTGVVQGPPQTATGAAFVDGRQRDGILDENPGNTDTATDKLETFNGPLGSILRFGLRTSLHVRQSMALFDELGTTKPVDTDNLIIGKQFGNDRTLKGYKYIDTLVNVVGVTTGYSIDVPIRIIKKS